LEFAGTFLTATGATAVFPVVISMSSSRARNRAAHTAAPHKFALQQNAALRIVL